MLACTGRVIVATMQRKLLSLQWGIRIIILYRALAYRVFAKNSKPEWRAAVFVAFSTWWGTPQHTGKPPSCYDCAAGRTKERNGDDDATNHWTVSVRPSVRPSVGVGFGDARLRPVLCTFLQTFSPEFVAYIASRLKVVCPSRIIVLVLVFHSDPTVSKHETKCNTCFVTNYSYIIFHQLTKKYSYYFTLFRQHLLLRPHAKKTEHCISRSAKKFCILCSLLIV